MQHVAYVGSAGEVAGGRYRFAWARRHGEDSGRDSATRGSVNGGARRTARDGLTRNAGCKADVRDIGRDREAADLRQRQQLFPTVRVYYAEPAGMAVVSAHVPDDTDGRHRCTQHAAEHARALQRATLHVQHCSTTVRNQDGERGARRLAGGATWAQKGAFRDVRQRRGQAPGVPARVAGVTQDHGIFAVEVAAYLARNVINLRKVRNDGGVDVG
jgi:hypothetical protein